MSDLVLSYLDVTKLAVAGFLARYREPTLGSYQVDLRCYLRWCTEVDVDPLRVTRAQLELYVRALEAADYAPATIARRFCTVATFLKYAVIDGHIPTNPADAVTRPKVEWQGQKRTVLHPLEFAALLAAARCAGGTDHALVALLGMLGLRVSEACHADIDDIRYQSGYEILHVLGKGAKPADIPLPIPVLRAIRGATDGREHGPILLNSHGHRMDTGGAARRLRRLCARAGIDHRISPHSLRRTFCTTGLVAGVPIRDMQVAMRHSDPRTTMRYDMAQANLDRHAAHAVAAYLAGMSSG
jgi:site-specific recombinase XerD